MIGVLAGAFMTATRVDGFGPDAPRDASLGAGPGHAIRAWAAGMRRAAAERHTARDLRGLDDALLRDIGLTRDEAYTLARTGKIGARGR